MNEYEDIIEHPHHVSQKRPRMSMHERAAQFSPFAALAGHEDAIMAKQQQIDALFADEGAMTR